MTRTYHVRMQSRFLRREFLLPLILTAAIVVIDQITKVIVVRTIPLFVETGYTIEVLGSFFRLTHVRNLGVAFSIGHWLAPGPRKLLFIALPIVVIVVLFFGYYLSDEVTRRQRWCIAAILGGGVGNIIDRIARPLGVVDFLDVRFYGLFGLERWPTFNVADSAVVVGGLLLVASLFHQAWGQRQDLKGEEP